MPGRLNRRRLNFPHRMTSKVIKPRVQCPFWGSYYPSNEQCIFCTIYRTFWIVWLHLFSVRRYKRLKRTPKNRPGNIMVSQRITHKIWCVHICVCVCVCVCVCARARASRENVVSWSRSRHRKRKRILKIYFSIERNCKQGFAMIHYSIHSTPPPLSPLSPPPTHTHPIP